MTLVDWKLLRDNAHRAMSRAYAPYSKYPVGAAALDMEGHLVTGCNVENVSYGLSLCAECVLVGNLISRGGGRLMAVTCCDASGAILMPCGRCRQVLLEHGGVELMVDTRSGVRPLGDLLPDAFGPTEQAGLVGEGEDNGHA
ncbi:cytidine deaminase [Rhodococcus xishaensis]|uniref:Cytidine deaminase n=1 Tax=Rhodococcus xishaensis TaxID=2487364 RepID=A0A438B4C2_9NOCA|nr:cytidine deaminase [Rhodococcus xishaensis]RVW05789.1 cytidine deaminase [Rhodococcus xishaensis]